MGGYIRCEGLKTTLIGRRKAIKRNETPPPWLDPILTHVACGYLAREIRSRTPIASPDTPAPSSRPCCPPQARAGCLPRCWLVHHHRGHDHRGHALRASSRYCLQCWWILVHRPIPVRSGFSYSKAVPRCPVACVDTPPPRSRGLYLERATVCSRFGEEFDELVFQTSSFKNLGVHESERESETEREMRRQHGLPKGRAAQPTF